MKHVGFFLSYPAVFSSLRELIAGRQARTKDFVRKNLEKYKVRTVLDAGCGTGDFIESLPPEVRYIGVDINQKFISFAEKKYGGKKRKFLVGDIVDKEFYQGKKFEAALLISMLHHFSNQELAVILPLVKKVTTKVLIVADIIPDPDGFLRRLMVKIDQGKFVRLSGEKRRVLSQYFKIRRTIMIPSRLAVQMGIICEI